MILFFIIQSIYNPLNHCRYVFVLYQRTVEHQMIVMPISPFTSDIMQAVIPTFLVGFLQ